MRVKSIQVSSPKRFSPDSGATSRVGIVLQPNIGKETAMTKYFAAAISAIAFLAACLPAPSYAAEMPVQRRFSSSVGEVVFEHQKHIQERSIECVECHHQINAKKLETPHPDYPGGHFKFPHLWPGQIPPGERQEWMDCYSDWLAFARRLAASLSR